MSQGSGSSAVPPRRGGCRAGGPCDPGLAGAEALALPFRQGAGGFDQRLAHAIFWDATDCVICVVGRSCQVFCEAWDQCECDRRRPPKPRASARACPCDTPDRRVRGIARILASGVKLHPVFSRICPTVHRRACATDVGIRFIEKQWRTLSADNPAARPQRTA